jgi:ureidoglycolate lyase
MAPGRTPSSPPNISPIILALAPITAAAFAPFGQLLPPEYASGGRQDLVHELQNDRAAARPRLSLLTIEPKALPLTAIEMERHVHSSQAFLPLDCASYLVLVAAHGLNDLPDVGKMHAFRVPGDTGINYSADTWHHPLTPLERVARFAVLTFVEGTPGDEQFVRLPRNVLIKG